MFRRFGSEHQREFPSLLMFAVCHPYTAREAAASRVQQFGDESVAPPGAEILLAHPSELAANAELEMTPIFRLVHDCFAQFYGPRLRSVRSTKSLPATVRRIR